VHWPAESVPAATLLHVPSEPAIAHDLQPPAQVVAQQIPCAQTFELHSLPSTQAWPIGFLPQVPPLQTLGEAQSVLSVHMVLHAPVPQTKGLHDVIDVAGWQVPAPSQVRAGVSIVPLQVAAAHCEPAA
jgi:hypothetical protein